MSDIKTVTCKGGPLDGRRMRIHVNTESFTTHVDPLGGSYVAKKTVATWVEKRPTRATSTTNGDETTSEG